jgi:peptide/nickel transport system ATP-binding protein
MDFKKIFVKKPTDEHYISTQEIRNTAKENFLITKEFEKMKARKNVPESEYLTERRSEQHR